MFFTRTTHQHQRGRALSARVACGLVSPLFRSGGGVRSFFATAMAASTFRGDSLSASTTKGIAMNLSTTSRAVQREAFPFPAPLQVGRGQHDLSVSEGFASCEGVKKKLQPVDGSSPLFLKEGNSHLVKCVVSEAGSY